MNMTKFMKIAFAASLVALMAGCAPVHKVQVAAHRGYWKCEEAGFAQNSIKSLELAQANHLWGSEFDVQMTSDGVLIVNHDNSINKVLIWDNPYSAFQGFHLKNGEKIPTFDEYLAQGAKSSTTVMVCELKEQKNQELENVMTDKCIEAIKAHDMYDPKRIIFISFSLNICKRIAEKCPGFTNQYLGDDLTPDQIAAYGINGIDFQYKLFAKHPDWYKQARNHKMSINAWTVNDSTDIKSMIDLGVDCITTNEPLRVRAMLGKKENVIKK